MAKQRFINTKFWSDTFVRDDLNPLDRYLFLYFLTNERTNIAWIYELPISIISFETGIEKENLLKMMERLKPKVYYHKWWVYIKNFQKHQSTESKTVKVGIDREMQLVPKEIIEYIQGIDRVCIPPEDISYTKPILNLDLDSNLDLIDTTIVVEQAPSYWNKDVNDILEKIKMYNNWIIDWTVKEQRQYWKMLFNKINKIESVIDWKYTPADLLEIILKIISKNDYHSHKIVWPKKIYYELAGLMQICKQDIQKEDKSKIPFIPWI